ncbi:MAG: putative pyridoxal phosphate-dependent enzyme [Parcubacteria group bacterium GW2011_GWA1_36_12]|nr:MAG: putative pyridoxal phosphate-dependent enzyme [Parcubacteria group bacterium GW2011_GWA1_36_12]
MLPRINKLPVNYVPLSPPYLTVDEEKVLSKVLRSGILALGPYLELFEKSFAKFIGTRFAVTTSSGTAGLHLALVALGIKTGDEVVTSPFSFVASANAILYCGAKVVFVDIDPVTFNIDPNKIERVITKNTKAILPIHVFGYPINYDNIMTIAKKYNLKVVEDACQSLGAVYNGKMVGNFGNMAIFAFYPNKQITTGEGGIVTTNSKKQHGLLKSLVNQGRNDDGQWLVHNKLGYNYRMDEISAALGYIQMKKIKQILKSRKLAAKTYQEYLKNVNNVSTLAKDNEKSKRSWQTFIVMLDKSINRDKVMEILISKKIQCKPYLPSIHLQPYWRKQFKYKENTFPVSESVSKRSLALPLFTLMPKKMIERVCFELEKAIKRSRIIHR